MDMLAPALRRPGRLDLLREGPPPDAAGRAKIFEVHLRGKPVSADLGLDDLARRTDGFTGADIERVCHRAALAAVREFIEKHGDAGDPSRMEITRDEFAKAIQELATRRGGRP